MGYKFWKMGKMNEGEGENERKKIKKNIVQDFFCIYS